MFWTCTKEGLGHMFTWKMCQGWNCLAGERERGRQRIRYMGVNCDGGLRLMDDRGSGGYDPLW